MISRGDHAVSNQAPVRNTPASVRRSTKRLNKQRARAARAAAKRRRQFAIAGASAVAVIAVIVAVAVVFGTKGGKQATTAASGGVSAPASAAQQPFPPLPALRPTGLAA